MALGRNDLCPCGSGLKYKKCCQPKHSVISLEAARADSLFREVWDKLTDYMASPAMEETVSKGFDRFFASPLSDEEEEEGAANLALDWVPFAYRTPVGLTPCEMYAASAKGLTDQQRALVRSWSASAPGFFRVDAVSGRACELTRLPDGRAFSAQLGGTSLKAGDLISAWLLPVLDTHRFGYLVQHVERHVLDPLMHLVTIEMELLRRQRPGATWDELYREHWPRVIDAVTMAVVEGEKARQITLTPGRAVLADDSAPVAAGWPEVEALIRQAETLWDEWIDPDDVAGALRLWRDGARLLRPQVRGAHGWAAAVLYLYLRVVVGSAATQAEAADRFHASTATVSKHSRTLAEALQPSEFDPRYVPLMNPFVRMEWRRYCLEAMGMADGDNPFALMEADVHHDDPVRRAEALIDQAWEATGARRIRLAEQAIKLWPGAADAFVILGQEALSRGDLREARRLSEAGVQAGERALGADFFVENVGHFYGIVESRPYMRALGSLADCLWVLGEREEALAHYEEMLRLNPGDNQGVRYILASRYLQMGDDARLGRLLAQHGDEATAVMGFTRALLQFRRSGAGKVADKLLAEAVAENSHVAAYLLGQKQVPRRPPDYIDFGGPLEAQEYAREFGEGWARTEGALDWLRSRTR